MKKIVIIKNKVKEKCWTYEKRVNFLYEVAALVVKMNSSVL